MCDSILLQTAQLQHKGYAHRMDRNAGAKTLCRSKLEFRSAGLLNNSAGNPAPSSLGDRSFPPAFLLAPLKRDRSGFSLGSSMAAG